MSRIHEALKRAQQERIASQAAQGADERSEHTAANSVIETTMPHLSVLQQHEVLPPANGAHSATEVVTDSLTFEELSAKCSRPEWRPDPAFLVFNTGDPFSPGTEQFRTLRSRLYRMRESQPLHTILISSAIPAEGKTMVAANLAHAMARQSGCRVLLIDADIRSPRIHKLLGAPATPGLADYLQNSATEFNIIQRGLEDGFCFIPAGNNATHPSELISSNRMRELLARVNAAFDWIIIDSPPALPVADASVLAGLADGVLFVVRANSTPAETSQKACKELRDANILGVVLNSAEGSAEYNSYYSGAGYGRAVPAKTTPKKK